MKKGKQNYVCLSFGMGNCEFSLMWNIGYRFYRIYLL